MRRAARRLLIRVSSIIRRRPAGRTPVPGRRATALFSGPRRRPLISLHRWRPVTSRRRTSTTVVLHRWTGVCARQRRVFRFEKMSGKLF